MCLLVTSKNESRCHLIWATQYNTDINASLPVDCVTSNQNHEVCNETKYTQYRQKHGHYLAVEYMQLTISVLQTDDAEDRYKLGLT